MASSFLFLTVILSSFSFAFVPQFVGLILQIFYQDSESQAYLRRQISDFKSELAQISMVSEFAKYAKIQRKVNKMNQELAKQNQQHSSSRLKARLIANAILYSLNSLFILFLLWSYGSEIVLQVSSKWLFPVNYLVVKTSADDVEGVSTTCWLFISGTVAKIVNSNLQGWFQTKTSLNVVQ